MGQFHHSEDRVNVRYRFSYLLLESTGVRLRSKNQNDEAFPYLWIHRLSRKKITLRIAFESTALRKKKFYISTLEYNVHERIQKLNYSILLLSILSNGVNIL